MYEEKNKTSITQMEYRHAYERFKQKNLKIAAFVRKEVWDIREDRKALESFLEKNESLDKEVGLADIRKIAGHASKFVTDSEHIFEFIKEISRTVEMKDAVAKGSGYPEGNWLHQFSGFEDIISALEQVFKTSLPLRKVALATNAKHEILLNLTKVLEKYGNELSVFNGPFPARKVITDDIRKTSRIKGEHLGWLAMYCFHGVSGFGRLSTIFLDEALKSGDFLEFDPRIDAYKVGTIQDGLLKLKTEMETLRSIETWFPLGERIKFANEYLPLLKTDERNLAIDVPNLELVKPISCFDHHINVVRLSVAVYFALNGEDGCFEKLSLNPSSPFTKQAEELKAETPTIEDVENWIRKI